MRASDHPEARDENPNQPPAPGQGRALAWALASPASVLGMPKRAWFYFVLYLGLAALVLGLVAWQLAAHEDDIRSLVLGYVLPESWHFAAEILVDLLFAQQHYLVIVNALVTTSLMVVTITLFPVKELLSAAFEEDGRLLGGAAMSEHPLWEQGWQEIKLLLLFLAVQSTIFWLGLYSHPMAQLAAVLLGFAFLWFSFAIDFIAPIFQRHLGHYSTIIKTLVRYAPAALVFAALLTAPTAIVARLWSGDPSWSLERALFLLFGVNVVCIAWAAASGTWLGAKLYPGFLARGRSHPATRVAAWLVVLALLAVNGYVFGSLGLSVHHKSQLLKCQYSVDTASFGVDTPGLGALLGDAITVSVHVDVVIENPTPFDLEIEESDIVFRHQDERVAVTTLAPLAAPAGQTVTQTVRFSIQTTPSMLRRGLDLFDLDEWGITLYVEITPHLDLPVRLL